MRKLKFPLKVSSIKIYSSPMWSKGLKTVEQNHWLIVKKSTKWWWDKILNPKLMNKKLHKYQTESRKWERDLLVQKIDSKRNLKVNKMMNN